MPCRRVLCVLPPLIVALTQVAAEAGIYQAVATGTVTSTSGRAGSRFNWAGVAIGDPVEVTYLFDSETPDLRPDDPLTASYELISLHVDVGPISRNFEADPRGYIYVVAGKTNYYEVAVWSWNESELYGENVEVTVHDIGGTLFADDAIPTTTLDFDPSVHFGSIYMGWETCDGKKECHVGPFARADLESIEIQAVPEPGVGVLLAAAVVGVTLRRRKVRQAERNRNS